LGFNYTLITSNQKKKRPPKGGLFRILLKSN
jgi:hypothetical protein